MMSQQPRSPSFQLMLLARLARWAFGLVLSAWVLLMLAWGALELFIVPRIGEFRADLEMHATRALGVPVRIGAVRAHAQGTLLPTFALDDVRLFDPQGREALHLPRVLAALSPRSLWNLGFEQIYIERPQLEVRRASDGRIFVAGLDFSRQQDDEGRAADWFFAQTEFVVRDGALTWVDESRGTPALDLQQVDFVARNRGWQHALRLDATPPADWGRRFTVQAQFRHPLLSTHPGRWREWEGQLYALFEQIDVARLKPYLGGQQGLHEGQGAVRAWLNFRQGQAGVATADVDLRQARVQLGTGQTAWALPVLQGRVGGQILPGGFDVMSDNLRFETDDGLRWAGGKLRVAHQAATGQTPARGEIQAEQIDLALLAAVARRLPLAPDTQSALQAQAPEGLVERLQASWQGELTAPVRYELRGRVARLGLGARLAAREAGPGLHGASIDFDFTQAGGRASVNMQDGRLLWPAWFEEPEIRFDRLSTEARWSQEGEQLSVQLSDLKFSNADAQGELQLKWQTGAGPARLPGTLDLQGSLSRANAARVHRYLPLEIDREVRHYLRDAISQGQAGAVRLRVKGALGDFPFAQAGQGEFQISAHLRDVSYAYVPRSVQAADALPWPALTQLSGDLLLDRTTLQLRQLSGRVAGAGELRITRGESTITDLRHAVIDVQAEAKGPLAEMLKTVVNGSPLAEMTGRALGQARAGGQADYQFKLRLPLANLAQTQVQGKVALGGNELQWGPDWPRMQRLRGAVHFSERGFALVGVQARLLGGDARAEGGNIEVPGPGGQMLPPTPIRINGRLTAEGLRQAGELGPLARLGQKASGSTPYSAVIDLRRDVPEWHIQSSLQGLALEGPAPLGKRADAVLPVRAEARALAGAAPQDQVQLQLGSLASATYVRDLAGAAPRVLRGVIVLGQPGGEALSLPTAGVAARLDFEGLDLDAWSALFSAPSAGAGRAEGAASQQSSPYVPSSLTLQAGELVFEGRRLRRVVAGGSREAGKWRFNLDAQELSGYLEYRPASGAASAGQLYARLGRLALAASEAGQMENLLDTQPSSVPALDIVVGELELRGRKLGRLEVEARNPSAREWRLSKLNLILPEGRLTASGAWAYPVSLTPAATPGRARTPAERRRTLMDFKLDIEDAGELLARLGMKDVVRKGHGRMEGQVTWTGSPLAIDYPSLGGALTVNVEGGQFLKADPGIAKLLGVLNLQALPRRLMLDFRDVFSEGFAFDFVRGDVQIQQGVASSNNLQMKGVNAAVLMEGHADIARETQDLKVVVVPDLNTGTASLITTWINPVAGLTSFLAQLFLRQPLMESSTQEFHIDGSWSDPRITRVENKPPAGGGGKR